MAVTFVGTWYNATIAGRKPGGFARYAICAMEVLAMPSPFPGMDPFIEGQLWEDFHHGLIELIREILAPAIRPRYVARVEERIVVENEFGDHTNAIRPDMAVIERNRYQPDLSGAGVATLPAIAPLMLHLPMPERQRQAFLTLRTRPDMQIVTVIEVLSPANKRAASAGRGEYLSKRDSILHTDVHLVELDLLRGGERLPTVEPLPPADYYAFVCRGNDRPLVQVYPWSLRHALPTLPVPLAGEDPDVMLELGGAFSLLYDRAGYDYSIDYARPVSPALAPADAEWVQQVLSASHAA
jgi:hypothetical protein